LFDLEKEMTPEQIDLGESKFQKWLKNNPEIENQGNKKQETYNKSLHGTG